MPAATIAPPVSSPAKNPPAPKPGPSLTAVNMPLPPSVEPKPADAPGTSSTEDMETRLAKFARPVEETLTHPNQTPVLTDPPKTEPKPATEPDESKAGDPKTVPAHAPDETKIDPKNAKKVSPWKLVDEHKAARLKAETEVAELRKLVRNEAEAKAETERLTKAEARSKELEDHLRFIDYQNHPEFKEKYQKPYDDAWNRLMKRLSGVGVLNPDGTKRNVEVKDILELGQLPADTVIELAEAKFGKLGTYVSERVEELKQLSEAKFDALDRAKKEGAEKMQREAQEFETKKKELRESLSASWKKASEEIETHSKYGRYFKPVEGDQEFNARLQKGTEFVDKALSENPTDAHLTTEQREAIVKRHAALRQRARAFGPMQLTIERQAAEIERLKTELGQFKASEPNLEGQRKEQSPPPENGYTMDSFQAALAQRARPGAF